METVSCDNCHSNSFLPLSLETSLLRLPEPYRVVECTACHLVYMNPRMTAKEYEDFYSSKYYDDYDYGVILSDERNPKFLRRVEYLNRLKPTKGKLLDIGTATGEFLKAARDEGWNVLGTEVSRYAAEEAKKKFGIDVFVGDAARAPFPAESFDVVHLSHVLEHVPSPRQTMKLAYRLLKKDGLFVVEVPNQFANWFERIAQIFGIRHPTAEPSLHHVYFYTPKSLRMLLAAEGYNATIRTYSLNVPYSRFSPWLRPFAALASRFIDRFGGGLYIEAYAKKRS